MAWGRLSLADVMSALDLTHFEWCTAQSFQTAHYPGDLPEPASIKTPAQSGPRNIAERGIIHR
jgi:hypothetical protein